ncbi:MAG: PIG-L family deacetylase [Methanobacterium sp.]|jgi:LmbE family N-acetylglucosaminyl deacetylase
MRRQIKFLVLILLISVIISGLASLLNVINNADSQFLPITDQNNQFNQPNVTANISNELTSNKVAIILPHPDDEAIGMGGWIQKLKSQGKEIHCVLLTSGNGITSKVPLCNNYYGLNIPQNASAAERKKIIREDSFKRVMNIFECSYEMMGIDDGTVTTEMVYNVMEKMYRDGYTEFYTTTGDYNVDHLSCHNAMKSMLEKYPQLKYRQFPVYWHSSPKYKPMPIVNNYTDYNIKEHLPKKQEAFEVYYNIEIFKRGLYKMDIERIYYIN